MQDPLFATPHNPGARQNPGRVGRWRGSDSAGELLGLARLSPQRAAKAPVPVPQSRAWLRFQRPLIEPCVRISRTRLSEFPSAAGVRATRLALRCSRSRSFRPFRDILSRPQGTTISPGLPFVSGSEQPESLRSADVTPLFRYYGLLRLLTPPRPTSVLALYG